MAEMSKNDLLTVKQTAQALSCSAGTVRNLLRLGKLPCLRFGVHDRVVRIHKDDVTAFIDRHRQATTPK